MDLERLDLDGIKRKTRAFLRGLEATLDDFISRTVSKGEELLQGEDRDEPAGEREGPDGVETESSDPPGAEN